MAQDDGQKPAKKKDAAGAESQPLANERKVAAAPSLAVNVAAPGAGSGGIRSPLMAGGRAFMPADEAQSPASTPASTAHYQGSTTPAPYQNKSQSGKMQGAAANEAVNHKTKNKSNPVGYTSAIAGMNQRMEDAVPSQITALQNLTFGMADPYEERRKKYAWGVVGALVLATILVFFLKPELVDKVIDKAASVNYVMEKYRQFKNGKGQEKSKVAASGKVGALTMSATAKKAMTRGLVSCKPFLQRSGVGVSAAPTVAAAECLMLQDNYTYVESMLKRYRSKLVTMGEQKLNQQQAANTDVDVMHLLTQVYLKVGRPDDVDRLLSGRCRGWKRTNTCVARLMSLADRHLTNAGAAGLKKMLADPKKLSGKATARFLMAAAQIEDQSMHASKADSYFRQALASLPPTPSLTKKMIYDTNAVSLFQRGDVPALRKLVRRGLRDLAKIDPGAKVKLRLLNDLTNPKQTKASFRTLLGREEITYRSRGDYELIEILGPEALRRNQEEVYLQLLKRTKAHYGGRYKAGVGIMRKLSIWEIRTTMAQRQLQSALKLLDQYDAQYQADQLSHHLRGSLLLLTATNGRMMLQAAAEFRQSLRMARNWEGLYGLGVALTRGGKLDQAQSVLKDMERYSEGAGQKYWLEMLRGEYLIAAKRLNDGEAVLKKALSTRPEAFAARILLLSLYKKADKKAELRQIEGQLEELESKIRLSSSREAFASPIGVMALATRPLQ